MAKTTNFLSIALLVSVLAVRPMFAHGAAAEAAPAAAHPHETVAHKLEEKVEHILHPHAPAAAAAAEAAPAAAAAAAPAAAAAAAPAAAAAAAPAAAAAAAPAAAAAAAEPNAAPAAVAPTLKGASVFAAIDHLNPFEYGKTAQANNPTISAAAKYLTVIGLVASNSGVHSVIGSIVSAVQNACGVADADQSEDDSTKEPRLTIGRRS